MLLATVASNGRNNILPIPFAIVEGEIAKAWFFFLAKPMKICNSERWPLPHFLLSQINKEHIF